MGLFNTLLAWVSVLVMAPRLRVRVSLGLLCRLTSCSRNIEPVAVGSVLSAPDHPEILTCLITRTTVTLISLITRLTSLLHDALNHFSRLR